jgi:hypothetical protein
MPATIALELGIVIFGLIAKHGIPAALQMIKQWDITEPTLEALKEMVPPTDTYFQTPPESPEPSKSEETLE